MTEKQIRLASEKEELRHLNGMLKEYGDVVSSKFAAMCCGNSFYDGAKWMQNEIASVLGVEIKDLIKHKK